MGSSLPQSEPYWGGEGGRGRLGGGGGGVFGRPGVVEIKLDREDQLGS